jgi:ATP adenylyltransferase
VNEDRLWAPWRMEYVAGDFPPAADSSPKPAKWLDGADRECFLCQAAARYDDQTAAQRRSLVAAVGKEAFVILNRYPYNNGHVMVAPQRHVAELDQISPAEHAECMAQLGRLTGVYRRRLNAEGFNIGLNLGRVAGAGVPGHLHWHLVPRWLGDNNFMPVLAGTRVIPQSLHALWELLVEEL